MSENDYDLRLEELKHNSVDRLLLADTFDRAAFELLAEHLWMKAVGLRHEHVISKQVLQCIRSACSAIATRAEYLPGAREHLWISRDFELMLDMLIAGEVREDRKSGASRVI